MPSEVDTLQSDLAELQARLKAAGLDYSLPSEAKKADDSKAAAASAPSKAKPDKAASDAFVKDLEDEDRSPEELAAIRTAAENMDMEKVGALKAEGNEHFRKQNFKEACAAYLQAIRMLDKGEMVDAKLYSNMAAAQLALDKFVAAAMYAQKCTEADPEWWKGYWYRGQALMKMLRDKPPSTAMSERCEQAKFAFEGCLKCPTLPPDKKAQVEEELQTCKNALMQMTGCGQQ